VRKNEPESLESGERRHLIQMKDLELQEKQLKVDERRQLIRTKELQLEHNRE
jgi:hypothetical protein